MKRFKNILAVLDWQKDNEYLLGRAFDLAKRNISKLTLVEVFDEPKDVQGRNNRHSRQISEIYSKGIAHEINKLELRGESWKTAGVDVSVTPILGNPVVEICRKVIRDGHDLVIIGIEYGADEDARHNPLWGLPMRLIRKCPCDVWALKPTPLRGFSRIVASINPEFDKDKPDVLNTRIMELASSLAQVEESELHVFHAWLLYGEEMLRGKVDDRLLETWLIHKESASVEVLDRFLQPFNERITAKHLKKGLPEIILPSFLDDLGVDLLVMGTLCRTGIPGFFIGNTAEKILQEVNCSVLAVKPNGFVGPIR